MVGFGDGRVVVVGDVLKREVDVGVIDWDKQYIGGTLKCLDM